MSFRWPVPDGFDLTCLAPLFLTRFSLLGALDPQPAGCFVFCWRIARCLALSAFFIDRHSVDAAPPSPPSPCLPFRSFNPESACPSCCMCASLFLCLPVSLLCLSIYLSACRFVCWSVCLLSASLPPCVCFCFSACLLPRVVFCFGGPYLGYLV